MKFDPRRIEITDRMMGYNRLRGDTRFKDLSDAQIADMALRAETEMYGDGTREMQYNNTVPYPQGMVNKSQPYMLDKNTPLSEGHIIRTEIEKARSEDRRKFETGNTEQFKPSNATFKYDGAESHREVQGEAGRGREGGVTTGSAPAPRGHRGSGHVAPITPAGSGR